MDDSNTNDVQEDGDYVEMDKGDLNYISSLPNNMFSFLGGQQSWFRQKPTPGGWNLGPLNAI